MIHYRTIRLYGQLGTTFGRVHRLAVSTTAEAIRAMCVTIPGFEKFLVQARQRGLTFAVFNGKNNIGADELETSAGDSDIRIAPVIIGSKSGGLFQTILGIGLIAVAAFMVPGGFSVAGAFQAGGWIGATAMMGAALALGGVMQMLSPQPKGLSMKQADENKPSYAFGGAVNTTAQGNPIPILYGRRRIGGAIISAGVYADESPQYHNPDRPNGWNWGKPGRPGRPPFRPY